MLFIVNMFCVVGLITVMLMLTLVVGFIVNLFNKFKYRNNRSFYNSRRKRW